MPDTMKAIVCRKYGPPEVLRLEQVTKPTPRQNEVLIRVRATAVNSADWRLRKPDPGAVRLFFGLFAPRKKILGGVLAGEVAQIGARVTKFSVGDRVFGSTALRLGAYAEYICLSEAAPIAKIPDGVSFSDAAALAFGVTTALHFLRQANIQPGQKVLVIGASGAVGTAAVQLAKHFGAEVTAVCSGANAALVTALGAKHVVDYQKQTIAASGEKYDTIYETVASTPYAMKISALKPGGTLVLSDAGPSEMLRALWSNLTRRCRVVVGVAKETAEITSAIAALMERGAVRAVIDRTYPLEQMAEAHRYVEGRHKKGSVVVTLP